MAPGQESSPRKALSADSRSRTVRFNADYVAQFGEPPVDEYGAILGRAG